MFNSRWTFVFIFKKEFSLKFLYFIQEKRGSLLMLSAEKGGDTRSGSSLYQAVVSQIHVNF